MYTTYHLDSAQEISSEIIDAIKATFKSKAITIIVEDNEDEILTKEMKIELDNRLKDNESEFISSEQSISSLKSKYGI